MNMRERIARAIVSSDFDGDAAVFDTMAPEMQENFYLNADAVLAEMAEPTSEMISAGLLAYELIGIAGGIINTAEEHVSLIFSAAVQAARDGK